ncbi:MAG TPA: DUF5947 family protein [Bryobacteraceae bacterium]|nr:DUF5947 family protein [Bryobacteraceae bacterium]
MATVPLAALRRFVSLREPEEHCDTCGAPLERDHRHTFESASQRVRCACESCSILYADIFRAIPEKIRSLPEFQLSDEVWNDLRIPISLAFFRYSTPAGRVIAQYPGPAGVTESLLPLEAWKQIESENPALAAMESDVEALLVNRVGRARDYFIVPVDECFRLAGVIRLHWRGLAGGALVWGKISEFLESLRRKGAACAL